MTAAAQPSTSATTRSLYADWQLRREQLENSADKPEHHGDQLRVLDYLLSRYRDTELARLPALFPLNTVLKFDRRAMLVHHHLGRCEFGGVKTEAEARQRTATILGRLAKLNLQSDVKAPGNEMIVAPASAMTSRPSDAEMLSARDNCAAVKLAMKMHFPARTILKLTRSAVGFGPYLTEDVIQFMIKLLSDPKSDPIAKECAEIFTRCTNPSAINYAPIIWRERVARRGDDVAAREIARLLTARFNGARTIEKIRSALADDHASVRIRAAVMLGIAGSAHDIGLLLDLLSLPVAADEGKHERRWYVRTLNKLARKIN
jgi:hypothetical protein